MRRFDSVRILMLLACAACGSNPEPPPQARVDSVPAPAPEAPTPAAPRPAEPAAPKAPTPAASRPAEPAAPKAPSPAPAEFAPKATASPDKPRPARTQASIETEKLNRANSAAPSPVPAEPIAAAPQPEPQPSAPEPAPAPAPPPAAKPAGGRVVVPSTSRLRVDVPAGLQRWLDADTRMQPWLNKVVPVIDRCYGNVLNSNPNAKGTISFRVTMHANARPDPDVQSLPGELSGIVTCATGQLMRTKMPLFTGTEGESYTVKVRFGE